MATATGGERELGINYESFRRFLMTPKRRSYHRLEAARLAQPGE